jgi:hypothetical protein
MKHDTAIEAARIEARRQWAEVPETNDADVIGHACDVGFLAGYEAGKPSWVAIEDGLPKESGFVLATRLRDSDLRFPCAVVMIWFDAALQKFYLEKRPADGGPDYIVYKNQVTAWMPLPPPFQHQEAAMTTSDVLEAIDKLPDDEIMWYGPASIGLTATPGLTTRALKSLATELREYRQMIEDARDVVFRGGVRIVHGSFRNPPDELYRIFYRDSTDTFMDMLDAWRATKR